MDTKRQINIGMTDEQRSDIASGLSRLLADSCAVRRRLKMTGHGSASDDPEKVTALMLPG